MPRHTAAATPAADSAPAQPPAAEAGQEPAGRAQQEPAGRVEDAAAQAAEIAQETGGLGALGRPVNRRSPFFIGLTAAAGVAVTYGLAERPPS